jgi:hypothetical protein
MIGTQSSAAPDASLQRFRLARERRPQQLRSAGLLRSWATPEKPAEGLVAGQVGTVVEVHSPGVFEVEFVDSHGRTVGLAELKRAGLLALKHEPAVAA